MTYEATTTVRRPRVALMWAAIAAYATLFIASIVGQLLLGHHGPGFTMFWWTAGPAVAAIQRRPKIEQAAVRASSDGLAIGAKLIPRERFASALMRTEQDRSYVCLRGKRWRSNVDVAVRTPEEADALCTALGLDAKSTTAEFTLQRGKSKTGLLVAGVLVALGAMCAGIVMAANRHALAVAILPLVFLALLMMLVPVLVLLNRVVVRVGADGLLVRDGLSRSVFYPHDAITRVNAEDSTVVIHRKRGEPLRFAVGAATRSRGRNPRLAEEHVRYAKSVVWRIQKARDAYQALAGAAPQAALALSRGERSVHDWIDALRRVGEGDGATFRDALPTREQLLTVVESTTAAAKERLAAAIALRPKLTDDEKPRVRIAAERCVAPDLRERMVRVLDAEADDQIAAVLEEVESAPTEQAR